MIVGHCPECGRDILADAGGKVVACIHTPPVMLILASLFGETFDSNAREPQGERSDG